MAIAGYNTKYPTLREAVIICLLRKFEVVDLLTTTYIWMKDNDYLTNYFGKFWIAGFFYVYFKIVHVTTMHCFVYQMQRFMLGIEEKMGKDPNC